jgi:hypothetical protein
MVAGFWLAFFNFKMFEMKTRLGNNNMQMGRQLDGIPCMLYVVSANNTQ